MKIKVTKTNLPYAGRRRAAFGAAGRSARRNIDIFLVSMVEEVSYLTGFTGDDSFVAVGDGWACLLTDGRYGEQAVVECPGVEVHVRKGAMVKAVTDVLAGRKVRSIALQAGNLTLAWKDALARAMPKVKFVHVSEVPALQRQVKDDQEVACIRRAVKIAQDAFLSMLAQGKKAFVGRTERQIAAEIDYRMRLAGADKNSFDTIVAVGPHASQPHYRPNDTVVKAGDPVLVDWGAFRDGYCSDLTRVVLTGKISPNLAEVYETVRRAQKAAMAAIAPGATCKKVDSAARAVIAKAGFGAAFVHGTGHGIGRQIHELPRLGQLSTTRLRRGMTVTVEPGIYLPGVGGVRIEDDVLVGPEGPVKLSSLPTEMAAMTLR